MFFKQVVTIALLLLAVCWVPLSDKPETLPLAAARDRFEQETRAFGASLGLVPAAFNAVVVRSLCHLGSGSALQQFLLAAQRKKPVIGVIGGSISAFPNSWEDYLLDYLSPSFPHNFTFVNGALGATGVVYFSSCLDKHLPVDVLDLVFIELAVNDLYVSDRVPKMHSDISRLLQRLKTSKNQPAIVFVYFFGNYSATSYLNGQELYEPFAHYYDIPSVSMKDALFHLVHPWNASRLPVIFADRSHPNKLGHKLAAFFVWNLFRKVQSHVPFSAFSAQSPSPFLGVSGQVGICLSTRPPANFVPDLARGWQFTNLTGSILNQKTFWETREWRKDNILKVPFSIPYDTKGITFFYVQSSTGGMSDAECWVDNSTRRIILNGTLSFPSPVTIIAAEHVPMSLSRGIHSVSFSARPGNRTLFRVSGIAVA